MALTADTSRATGYRFGSFVLSPSRRMLLEHGQPVRLIPRYFDLLVLLVESRDRAVHRQEIFDRVWSDVIVSDGALSQAIRTLRRALRDDPRDPRFIRTVSRHGYQFVHDTAIEVSDAPSAVASRVPDTLEAPGPSPASVRSAPDGDEGAYTALVDRLLAADAADEERRDAAEQLHMLGTERALAAIGGRPGEFQARALLRDARWDVAGAGDVPLVGAGGALASISALVTLRLRRAASLASRRWLAASGGGALAGAVAGLAGGLVLLLLPESHATSAVLVALAIIGTAAGALGAAGVGAGLAAAEALARSRRALGLVVCGAAGGWLAGVVGHGSASALLSSMFGQDGSAVGGGLEGLVLGAAAGAGYAIATTRIAGGGMATPHGGNRLSAALLTGSCCAVACAGLAVLDRHFVAASLDVVAHRFSGASVGLAPIARLLGEQELRPLTRTLVSGFEGLMFGAGLVLGLTRRPPVGE